MSHTAFTEALYNKCGAGREAYLRCTGLAEQTFNHVTDVERPVET